MNHYTIGNVTFAQPVAPWPRNDREWANGHATEFNGGEAGTPVSPLKIIADEMAAGTARFVSPPLVPGGPGKGYCSDPCEVTTCTCSPVPDAHAGGRTIIAFTGLAGAGKSTAAAHLLRARGFTRIRFAGPLKAMMAALGLTAEQIDGSEKETPCELFGGKTPRWAMQTLGTEWGRNCIGPDVWIRAWEATLVKVPGNVVVDDCRFPNEGAAVTKAGGILVRIQRPGCGAGAAGHSSEAHQLPAVATLHNTVSERNLREQVDVLLRDLSWRDTQRYCPTDGQACECVGPCSAEAYLSRASAST